MHTDDGVSGGLPLSQAYWTAMVQGGMSAMADTAFMRRRISRL